MQEYKDTFLEYYEKELQDNEREYYFKVFDPYYVLTPWFASYIPFWSITEKPKNLNPSFKINSNGLSEQNHDKLLLELFNQAVEKVGREKYIRSLLLDITVYWSKKDWENASVYRIQDEIDSNYLDGKPLLYPTNKNELILFNGNTNKNELIL